MNEIINVLGEQLILLEDQLIQFQKLVRPGVVLVFDTMPKNELLRTIDWKFTHNESIYESFFSLFLSRPASLFLWFAQKISNLGRW